MTSVHPALLALAVLRATEAVLIVFGAQYSVVDGNCAISFSPE